MFSSTKEKTRSATQKIILSENFFVEFRGYIKKNPSTSQRMVLPVRSKKEFKNQVIVFIKKV
jgi:hypothetical protein